MRDPMPRTRWLDALIILLTLAALAFMAQMLWGLLSQFSDIILLFALAALVAFALEPLNRQIENKSLPSGMMCLAKQLFGVKLAEGVEQFRVSRLVAVAVLYVALALILVGFIAVLIPPTIQQLQQLIDHYSDFARRGSGLASFLMQWLADIGVRSSDVSSALTGALGLLQSLAVLVLQNAFVFLQGAVNLVGDFFLVLLFSFFFALDGPRFLGKTFDLLPREFHDDARVLAVTMDRVFGGYLRATLLQAFLVGAGTAVVMGIFRAPYLLVASLFAGLFMLIPLVGNALALVPPVLATLSVDPTEAALVFIILLVYQLVIVNVVIPKLMSEALGLHPLLIMASLLVGVRIGGFWGGLFAVPVAGVLATMALFFYRRSVQGTKPAAEERAVAPGVVTLQHASPEA